ncbi:MAG: hypothetical protein LC754_12230 [Acidobacteria bacterium]|nr:hypothetical protein [Acidobacteriota bacterium]
MFQCGPGKLGDYVVPDSYTALGGTTFRFNGPCQRHDNCYGQCKRSKEQCDVGLLDDLIKVCNTTPGASKADRRRCRRTARDYYTAVKKFGSPDCKKGKKDE